MIDVAHDGYDRRARLEVFGVVLFTDEAFLDVGLGHAPDGVSEFLGNQLGGIGVDHVGDLAHLAVAHQELDDVDAALGHAVGELLDGDDLGNDDLALDLGLRLRVRLSASSGAPGGASARQGSADAAPRQARW